MKYKGLREFLSEEDVGTESTNVTPEQKDAQFFIYLGRYDTKFALDSVALLKLVETEGNSFYFDNLTAKEPTEISPYLVFDNGILFGINATNEEEAIRAFTSVQNMLMSFARPLKFFAKPINSSEFSMDSKKPFPGGESMLSALQSFSRIHAPVLAIKRAKTKLASA